MTSCVLLLLAIAIVTTDSLRIRITSISCTSDANSCLNPICKLKALNRYQQQFQLGCPSQSSFPSSWLVIENLRKSSSGFQPGFLRSQLDFCSMLDRNSVHFKLLQSILENFGKGIMPQLEKQWITCPLPNSWLLNLTLDERENVMGPVAGVVPGGEYRMHLWVVTKKTNHTIFDWSWNFFYSK